MNVVDKDQLKTMKNYQMTVRTGTPLNSIANEQSPEITWQTYRIDIVHIFRNEQSS